MKAEAELNWETLRKIVADDAGKWRKMSRRTLDSADVRADAYGRVLDAMFVLEHGLEAWQAQHNADPSWVPSLLAEHAAAAEDDDNEIPCTCREVPGDDLDCPLHGEDHDTAEDRMSDEVRKLESQGRA